MQHNTEWWLAESAAAAASQQCKRQCLRCSRHGNVVVRVHRVHVMNGAQFQVAANLEIKPIGLSRWLTNNMQL